MVRDNGNTTYVGLVMVVYMYVGIVETLTNTSVLGNRVAVYRLHKHLLITLAGDVENCIRDLTVLLMFFLCRPQPHCRQCGSCYECDEEALG